MRKGGRDNSRRRTDISSGQGAAAIRSRLVGTSRGPTLRQEGTELVRARSRRGALSSSTQVDSVLRRRTTVTLVPDLHRSHSHSSSRLRRRRNNTSHLRSRRMMVGTGRQRVRDGRRRTSTCRQESGLAQTTLTTIPTGVHPGRRNGDRLIRVRMTGGRRRMVQMTVDGSPGVEEPRRTTSTLLIHHSTRISGQFQPKRSTRRRTGQLFRTSTSKSISRSSFRRKRCCTIRPGF